MMLVVEMARPVARQIVPDEQQCHELQAFARSRSLALSPMVRSRTVLLVAGAQSRLQMALWILPWRGRAGGHRPPKKSLTTDIRRHRSTVSAPAQSNQTPIPAGLRAFAALHGPLKNSRKNCRMRTGGTPVDETQDTSVSTASTILGSAQ